MSSPVHFVVTTFTVFKTCQTVAFREQGPFDSTKSGINPAYLGSHGDMPNEKLLNDKFVN